MGEDCGSWTPQLHFGLQSPNLNSFGATAPLDVGKQNGISAVMNPGITMLPTNETMQAFASSALPRLQLGQTSEPHGWFYCLPSFRQGFTPAPNFAAEEKFPATGVKGFGEGIAQYGESGFPDQREFFVIDQTGGQTTVICSSRFGSPHECLGSWHSELHGANYLNGNEFSPVGDLNHMFGPNLAHDKIEDNQGTGMESELHEDTEEINALLYSDSDGYSTEEDEVTSTGHSPSTMTTQDNHETFKRIAEEVASSSGKTMKRKRSDGVNANDIQFMDTASSLNLKRSFDAGDDAESRCSSGNSRGSDEMGPLSGNKMRKEKIRDVLSVLQGIIPGGKDKDPVMLLDDAIRCLKSLKLKARALGLDALCDLENP